MSLSSYQPSMLTFDGVLVGGGRVVITPVGVYCGKRDGTAAAFEMVVGGQGYEEVALGGILPAPSPPVCHGRYVPPNGVPGVTPSAAHLPFESRGSFGIQPLSRPSLYDQSGAWTFPSVVSPI